MRITLDIDDPVLGNLNQLRQPVAMSFRWVSQAMEPRIDLRDKEALRDALDEPMR